MSVFTSVKEPNWKDKIWVEKVPTNDPSEQDEDIQRNQADYLQIWRSYSIQFISWPLTIGPPQPRPENTHLLHKGKYHWIQPKKGSLLLIQQKQSSGM